MTKTTSLALMMKTPAPAPRVGDTGDQPMTERTAAELRALARDHGVPFDTALTENQAQERIKALSQDG